MANTRPHRNDNPLDRLVRDFVASARPLIEQLLATEFPELEMRAALQGVPTAAQRVAAVRTYVERVVSDELDQLAHQLVQAHSQDLRQTIFSPTRAAPSQSMPNFQNWATYHLGPGDRQHQGRVPLALLPPPTQVNQSTETTARIQPVPAALPLQAPGLSAQTAYMYQPTPMFQPPTINTAPQPHQGNYRSQGCPYPPRVNGVQSSCPQPMPRPQTSFPPFANFAPVQHPAQPPGPSHSLQGGYALRLGHECASGPTQMVGTGSAAYRMVDLQGPPSVIVPAEEGKGSQSGETGDAEESEEEDFIPVEDQSRYLTPNHGAGGHSLVTAGSAASVYHLHPGVTAGAPPHLALAPTDRVVAAMAAANRSPSGTRSVWNPLGAPAPPRPLSQQVTLPNATLGQPSWSAPPTTTTFWAPVPLRAAQPPPLVLASQRARSVAPSMGVITSPMADVFGPTIAAQGQTGRALPPNNTPQLCSLSPAARTFSQVSHDSPYARGRQAKMPRRR